MVLANAVAEALGLGTTALIGAALVSYLGERISAHVTLELATVAVLAGTLAEGIVVGTAQWSVLRRSLSGICWKTWVWQRAPGRSWPGCSGWSQAPFWHSSEMPAGLVLYASGCLVVIFSETSTLYSVPSISKIP